MTTKKHKAVMPTQREAKVTWATWAAGLFSTLTAIVVADPTLIDGAPPWVRALVAVITGTGAVRLAASTAPHTIRTDVEPPDTASAAAAGTPTVNELATLEPETADTEVLS